MSLYSTVGWLLDAADILQATEGLDATLLVTVYPSGGISIEVPSGAGSAVRRMKLVDRIVAAVNPEWHAVREPLSDGSVNYEAVIPDDDHGRIINIFTTHI